MKYIVAALIASVMLSTVVTALAIEQPRLIPRSEEIARPAADVYASLKKYFSDPALSRYQLVSADPTTHTLVAKMSGIDNASWNNWTFCKTGPVEMIYKYEDGRVTVTVKIEETTRKISFATVTADFEGRYVLASNENKIACVSKGGLEEKLLAVAGGPGTK